MSRSGGFWQWYASASDSIRHEVIERGWFGRETTADINARDMPALPSEPEVGQGDASYDRQPEQGV